MRQSSKLTRIANFILFAEEDWVSFDEVRSETDAKRLLDSPEVHKTDRGYGRGPAPTRDVEVVENPQKHSEVPRWMKDTQFGNSMAKKRPDLNPEAVYEELSDYPDSKSKKLALHWTLSGGIFSPKEDKEKVLRAIKVSELKKIDPAKYKSPLEITESFGHEAKEDRIDPDKVIEFKNKKTLQEGVTYYDVEDSEEGQTATRRIVDNQLGKERNPWCVIEQHGDVSVNNCSYNVWRSKGKTKKIAFQNGDLVAFYADGAWWDTFNNPKDGIPIVSKIKDDKLGRKMEFIVNSKTGKKEPYPNRIFSGDANNGQYTTWEKHNPEIIKSDGERFKGHWIGRVKEYIDGQIYEEKNFNSEGLQVGTQTKYYNNEMPKGIEEYNEKGKKVKTTTLSYDGKVESITNYHPITGQRVGEFKEFDKNGNLVKHHLYSDNGDGKITKNMLQT
jgi:antitoxin component YwqK of YwqJK toxin-antitoxin module